MSTHYQTAYSQQFNDWTTVVPNQSNISKWFNMSKVKKNASTCVLY